MVTTIYRVFFVEGKSEFAQYNYQLVRANHEEFETSEAAEMWIRDHGQKYSEYTIMEIKRP